MNDKYKNELITEYAQKEHNAENFTELVLKIRAEVGEDDSILEMDLVDEIIKQSTQIKMGVE